MQVRMLYVGRLQTAHGTRVTHRRDARLEAGKFMVGEVARGLSLFGGASSEVRRCGCSVVV